MQTLANIELVPASVPRTATFLEAARVLIGNRSPMIAVLDERNAVIGFFGGDQVLRGLFPKYLEDLHHTAFATEDVLLERADPVLDDPVERHLEKPIVVDADSSAMHVAERFLHSELPAIAVVAEDEFTGMLVRADFCRAMLEKSESLRSG
ncbi:MAG: CBS domain-containing protein [Actinomycetota bacterium]|nr:CBS domain-containing protein [Actinomycetota bacterium]